jgi:hypothetical protein
VKTTKELLVLLQLTIFSFTLPIIHAQEAYTVREATLTVFRDGVVHVNISVSVYETEPLISIPLLSPIKNVSNILVLDENGSLLDYDINDSSMTIYSLGATEITIEYDTDKLTFKEFGIWTLKVMAPFNLIVIFPENANITYINAVPSAIRVRNNKVEIDLCPGEWEICYEILITPPSKPPVQQPLTWASPIITYCMVIATVTVICSALALTYVRNRRKISSLKEDEVSVLRFIKSRGGKVLEAELRENFSHIPRTSMWRLIKRLEKQGVVRIKKVGLQNVVELK